jgi:hypothetical protein
VTAEVHELVVGRPAARAIAEEVPEPVAATVIELITGSFIENPRRVGRELRDELTDILRLRDFMGRGLG